MGKPEDTIDAVQEGNADAVAMADILYYDRATINDIRSVAISADIEVRGIEYA
jgi:cyclase